MFTIIGGDGREYGPVDEEQVRAWLAAGRANLDTRARRTGEEVWRPLGEYPEFGTGGIPPPLPVDQTPTELASRWARLGAAILDQLLFMACVLPSVPIFGSQVFRDMISGENAVNAGDIDPARALFGLAVLLAFVGTFVIVQIWLLTTRGQTVGKMLLGIRIVRVPDGGNPGFARAVLLRSVVPALIGSLPYLGFFFVLTDLGFIFRPDRRCVHDHMASTRVVKA